MTNEANPQPARSDGLTVTASIQLHDVTGSPFLLVVVSSLARDRLDPDKVYLSIPRSRVANEFYLTDQLERGSLGPMPSKLRGGRPRHYFSAMQAAPDPECPGNIGITLVNETARKTTQLWTLRAYVRLSNENQSEPLKCKVIVRYGKSSESFDCEAAAAKSSMQRVLLYAENDVTAVLPNESVKLCWTFDGERAEKGTLIIPNEPIRQLTSAELKAGKGEYEFKPAGLDQMCVISIDIKGETKPLKDWLYVGLREVLATGSLCLKPERVFPNGPSAIYFDFAGSEVDLMKINVFQQRMTQKLRVEDIDVKPRQKSLAEHAPGRSRSCKLKFGPGQDETWDVSGALYGRANQKEVELAQRLSPELSQTIAAALKATVSSVGPSYFDLSKSEDDKGELFDLGARALEPLVRVSQTLKPPVAHNPKGPALPTPLKSSEIHGFAAGQYERLIGKGTRTGHWLAITTPTQLELHIREGVNQVSIYAEVQSGAKLLGVGAVNVAANHQPCLRNQVPLLAYSRDRSKPAQVQELALTGDTVDSSKQQRNLDIAGSSLGAAGTEPRVAIYDEDVRIVSAGLRVYILGRGIAMSYRREVAASNDSALLMVAEPRLVRVADPDEWEVVGVTDDHGNGYLFALSKRTGSLLRYDCRRVAESVTSGAAEQQRQATEKARQAKDDKRNKKDKQKGRSAKERAGTLGAACIVATAHGTVAPLDMLQRAQQPTQVEDRTQYLESDVYGGKPGETDGTENRPKRRSTLIRQQRGGKKAKLQEKQESNPQAALSLIPVSTNRSVLLNLDGALLLRGQIPDPQSNNRILDRAYDPRLNVWVKCGHPFAKVQPQLPGGGRSADWLDIEKVASPGQATRYAASASMLWCREPSGGIWFIQEDSMRSLLGFKTPSLQSVRPLERKKLKRAKTGNLPIPDHLYAGQELRSGERLRSPDGKFELALSKERLTLGPPGQQNRGWQSERMTPPLRVRLDAVGVLHLLSRDKPSGWSSTTPQLGGAKAPSKGAHCLRLQNEGILQIDRDQPSSPPLWVYSPLPVGSTLKAGQRLRPGQFLESKNNRFTLVFQAIDGNLVLYEGARTTKNRRWSTWLNQNGKKADQVLLAETGDLSVSHCERDGSRSAVVWRSQEHGARDPVPGSKNYRLELTDAGEIKIYSDSGPLLWRFRPFAAGKTLTKDERLIRGEYVQSESGQIITFDRDSGRLLYQEHRSAPLNDFVSYPNQELGQAVVLQPDGELCILDQHNKALWRSTEHNGLTVKPQCQPELVVMRIKPRSPHINNRPVAPVVYDRNSKTNLWRKSRQNPAERHMIKIDDMLDLGDWLESKNKEYRLTYLLESEDISILRLYRIEDNKTLWATYGRSDEHEYFGAKLTAKELSIIDWSSHDYSEIASKAEGNRLEVSDHGTLEFIGGPMGKSEIVLWTSHHVHLAAYDPANPQHDPKLCLTENRIEYKERTFLDLLYRTETYEQTHPVRWVINKTSGGIRFECAQNRAMSLDFRNDGHRAQIFPHNPENIFIMERHGTSGDLWKFKTTKGLTLLARRGASPNSSLIPYIDNPRPGDLTIWRLAGGFVDL